MVGAIISAVLAGIFCAIAFGQGPKSASIRKVDFRNFDYPVCDGPAVRLRKGKDQYGDTIYDMAEFKSVRYVDFDGDGKEEAFVILDWSTSGSAGGGVNAFVFAMRDGRARGIWSRCFGRSAAALVGKTIKFYYPDYVGDDPNCCPTYKATDTIAWRNGGFALISKRRIRNPK